jgi:hypothetical protein
MAQRRSSVAFRTAKTEASRWPCQSQTGRTQVYQVDLVRPTWARKNSGAIVHDRTSRRVRPLPILPSERAPLLGEPCRYSPHLRRMPTIATRWRLDATGVERHGNPVQARYPARLQRSMTVGIVIVIRADLTDYAGGATSGWQEGVRTLRHQMLASSQHQLHPGRGSGPVMKVRKCHLRSRAAPQAPAYLATAQAITPSVNIASAAQKRRRAARRRRAHCGPPDEGRETVVVGVSRCSSMDARAYQAPTGMCRVPTTVASGNAKGQ